MSTIASHLPLNISEIVRDRALVPKDHQQERPAGIEQSRDGLCHITLKGQVVTAICLKPNISKTAGDAISQQSLITRQSVVRQAVWSAILATAWLLVSSTFSWGYRSGSPTAVRPSDPALCGSCPLVTPYSVDQGTCSAYFVCILFCLYYCMSICVIQLFSFFAFSFVASPSVL